MTYSSDPQLDVSVPDFTELVQCLCQLSEDQWSSLGVTQRFYQLILKTFFEQINTDSPSVSPDQLTHQAVEQCQG